MIFYTFFWLTENGAQFIERKKEKGKWFESTANLLLYILNEVEFSSMVKRRDLFHSVYLGSIFGVVKKNRQEI